MVPTFANADAVEVGFNGLQIFQPLFPIGGKRVGQLGALVPPRHTQGIAPAEQLLCHTKRVVLERLLVKGFCGRIAVQNYMDGVAVGDGALHGESLPAAHSRPQLKFVEQAERSDILGAKHTLVIVGISCVAVPVVIRAENKGKHKI